MQDIINKLITIKYRNSQPILVLLNYKKITRKGLAVIYRQEILQDIALFTSIPKDQFYDKLFANLDLSGSREPTAKTGRNGFSKEHYSVLLSL